MNKYLLPLLLISTSAFALDLYHYNPIEGCSLRKAVNGAWQIAPASEVGQDSFPIIVSKANAAYSNFKYQGTWYAAKTECFQMSDSPADLGMSDAGTSGPGLHFVKGGIFVEPKLALAIMTGSGTSAGTTSSATIDKYSPSMGWAIKVGYNLTDHTDLFLEFNHFAGKRAMSIPPITSTQEDSVTSFNLGYQYFLSTTGTWLPYGALALGYNKLTDKITSSGGTATEYSGSGLGFILEAGVLYDLSSKIALMGALNYTVMNFSELTQSGTSTTQQNTTGYSHLGINFGARYNF